MALAEFQDEERESINLVDRWFRELDQRRILQGAQEWMVQVTGILRENDLLWIQIADDSRWAGSVLLPVRSTTSVEQAVRALSSRPVGAFIAYPKVIVPQTLSSQIGLSTTMSPA